MSISTNGGFLMLTKQNGKPLKEFVAVKGSAIVAVEVYGEGARIEISNGGSGFEVREQPGEIITAIGMSYREVTQKR